MNVHGTRLYTGPGGRLYVVQRDRFSEGDFGARCDARGKGVLTLLAPVFFPNTGEGCPLRLWVKPSPTSKQLKGPAL